MHTDTTPNLGLPLPHLANLQEEDVPRLRDAITQIDTALVAKESSANKGAANGYAPLGADAKIAALYLPSFVDDVLEFANLAAFPATGETGKMYVALSPTPSKIYRWGGSTYIEISPSPGSTDDVAEGAGNKYFSAARVLDTLLTGVTFLTNATIAVTDSVKVAIGKLQAQVSAILTALNTHTAASNNPHGTTAAQVGAPTTAGVGATGNWPINVTGMAGLAGNITGVATIANGGTGASNAVYALRNLNRGAHYYITTPGAVLVPGGNYQIYMGGYGSFSSSMPDMADTVQGDEIRVSNMFGYWGLYPWTLNCPANVFFTVPGGTGGSSDATLVCNQNIGGIVLRCSYNSGSTAYWSIV